ncbi:hypothetical protein F0562_019433 [Nyssa sinensis]|uniref:Uncharacterized protein n=1 Tax=Nyssa sinensis TaxID=561372 RepID=A0A5J5BP71_9ASTE|nr:hypothetical protein F0562_019433 [Nyssa sinensis]
MEAVATGVNHVGRIAVGWDVLGNRAIAEILLSGVDVAVLWIEIVYECYGFDDTCPPSTPWTADQAAKTKKESSVTYETGRDHGIEVLPDLGTELEKDASRKAELLLRKELVIYLATTYQSGVIAIIRATRSQGVKCTKAPMSPRAKVQDT